MINLHSYAFDHLRHSSLREQVLAWLAHDSLSTVSVMSMGKAFHNLVIVFHGRLTLVQQVAKGF